MRRFLYIPRKITQSLGYGALYNFYCTQEQHKEVTYGYLYNAYVFMDSRQITSEGWHVATDSEHESQHRFLGGNGEADKKLKEAGLIYWNSSTEQLLATNSSGFNGRGAGLRRTTGEFVDQKIAHHAWSTTAYLTDFQIKTLNFSSNWVADSLSRSGKNAGLSIRLVKDSTTLTNGQTGIYIGNDGKVYPTICINSVEWLASDLMETKYRDGSLIPVVTDNTAWAALTTGARCSYNNLESNAGTTKRLAPVGWHIPSTVEDNIMTAILGGVNACGKTKEIGFTHWDEPNLGATNESGLNVVGSGFRLANGSFQALKSWHGRWLSDQANEDAGHYQHAESYSNTFSQYPFNNDLKKNGLSILLIKDTSDWVEGETITDIEGNVYPTTKISDQVWTAANWKCERWNDGSFISKVQDNAAWSALKTPAMCYYFNDVTYK